ncbi:ECF RNA polymerase sigma-E factor [Botrimarina colliarenosi]|uniref:ECF RNA polymerase sigma-E factor n=1 Tax=Botrimarina colliarenosi TaxID=2528001 RepID=A0A5C6A9G0_9BACT|nr:RNA polymerase sigma factor [Botrimarina colliarenosi]TWT96076.1 ECF RNA polymerase sigma-E factor [Botrimarina colliarenosi]
MASPLNESPPPTGPDEEALVGRAVQGDQAALETLLVGRHDQLLRFIERSVPANLQAKVAADDLLQQTYLQVFKSIGSFESKGPGAFFAWLKTIASRKLIDATRSRGREQLAKQAGAPAGSASQSGYQSLMGAVAEGGPGAGTLAMSGELRGAFQVALANLPDNYREIVQLRYLDDLSLEEVAERLSVSTGAARGLCHRARQALRDEIMRLSRFI